MAKNDGGPAFPGFGEIFTTDAQGRTGAQRMWGMEGSPGMTLRDWFAGQALVGMRAQALYHEGTATPEQRARLAYIDADAMLKARESKE